jgi:hypothetical protein
MIAGFHRDAGCGWNQEMIKMITPLHLADHWDWNLDISSLADWLTEEMIAALRLADHWLWLKPGDQLTTVPVPDWMIEKIAALHLADRWLGLEPGDQLTTWLNDWDRCPPPRWSWSLGLKSGYQLTTVPDWLIKMNATVHRLIAGMDYYPEITSFTWLYD